jgi:tetratricopeptide (TPR) repeat protein
VARGDWFRNTSWSDGVEAAFRAKLNRARDKAQPLRIQASALTASHPEVALKLLGEYFALGAHFDHAQACVDRARAYIALKNFDAAFGSLAAALAQEKARPSLLTLAYLELPTLIAMERMSRHYDRAVEILLEHKARPMFPMEHYRWNGTLALLLHEKGQIENARTAAGRALDAANTTHSGFRYHPTIGLVSDRTDPFGLRLRKVSGLS